MWKFSTFLEFAFYVLLLLALPPVVNSNETPTPRMCAVCLENDCATGVRKVYPAGSDTAVWSKGNSPTGIQTCSMENLKADVSCKMANGSLVQLADNPLQFEGIDTSGAQCVFNSQISPCTDLNLPPSSTPSPGMCAVCLEKDCANVVTRIYPAGSDTTVWVKKNSTTGIQNCSMENLKADVPCKMANGNLVQLANEMLQFDSMHDRGVRHTFKSQISPCADLNLPFKPSLVTKAPIHITSNPAATNDSGIAIPIGIISSIIIFFIIFIISIRVLIWKRNSRGQGKDGERHGNNGVPPHDAEDRDENTMEKQPLKGEVPNGNFNGVHREDDSVGTAGLLGHCDHTPV